MHRRLAEAPLPLVRPDFIKLSHPGVEIGLQLVDRRIDLFAEGDAIELVEHGFVETLDDGVGLRAPGLGPGVIDVLDGEKEFAFMPLRITAIFGSMIGEHALQWDSRNDHVDCVALSEGHDGGGRSVPVH